MNLFNELKQNRRRILIAGCGRIGSRLGINLSEQGHTVWGLRRRSDLLPAGILPLKGDLATGDGLSSLPPDLAFVFYAASSGAPTEEAYKAAYSEGVRNLIAALAYQRQQIRRIFFVSSTGVYAQQSGEWVDENSPAQPGYPSGRYLLQGEAQISDCPYPGTIVRLAGIYGPGRNRLLQRVALGKEACPESRIQYTNLIHLNDCVAILAHLMRLSVPAQMYVAVDCKPVDRCILIHWLADQLKAPKPGTLPEEALPRRQLRSNKRCSNRRLLESGYEFSYPTFKDGYRSLIAEYQNSRPEEKS